MRKVSPQNKINGLVFASFWKISTADNFTRSALVIVLLFTTCSLAAEKNSTRAVGKMPEFYEVSDIEGIEGEALGVQHCSDCGSMWADRLALKYVIHWDAQSGIIRVAQGRWDLSVLLPGIVCIDDCLKVLSWSLLFLTFLLLRKKELTVRGSICTLSWWAWLNWSWPSCVKSLSHEDLSSISSYKWTLVFFKGCLFNSCCLWRQQCVWIKNPLLLLFSSVDDYL